MSNANELLPCPCGGPNCTGVGDKLRHHCGGPREACQALGCLECGAPSPDTAQLLARVAELEAENERMREQLAVLDEARSVEPYPVTIDDEAMNIRLTATVLVDHLPSQIVRRWALALIHTGLRILKTMDREVEQRHAVNEHGDCAHWCLTCRNERRARGES